MVRSRWRSPGGPGRRFSRAPSRLACRTRTVWQYRHVPSLSGLLPPSPASPGSGFPQLLPGRCDDLAAESFHLRTVMKRLVAHGFHVSHLRDTTGVGAPSTPGRRCSPRPDAVPGRRLPPRNGQSLHPAPASHQRGSAITGHQRGFTRFTRPVCPSPVAPGWDGRPSGFPLCSAPRRYQQRTTGRGRAVSTRPELRCRHRRPSNLRVHSHSATSCRNGRCGCSASAQDGPCIGA
jgi:hypothetical protein